MVRIVCAVLALNVLSGCAAAVPLRVGDDHPASASAPDGIVPQLSAVLSSDDFAVAPSKTSTTEAHSQHQSASEGAVYTCPMHPEVQQSQPGQCPKCGMRLVAKQPASKAQNDDGAASAHGSHR